MGNNPLPFQGAGAPAQGGMPDFGAMGGAGGGMPPMGGGGGGGLPAGIPPGMIPPGMEGMA